MAGSKVRYSLLTNYVYKGLKDNTYQRNRTNSIEPSAYP
jgi:hypothetical protein